MDSRVAFVITRSLGATMVSQFRKVTYAHMLFNFLSNPSLCHFEPSDSTLAKTRNREQRGRSIARRVDRNRSCKRVAQVSQSLSPAADRPVRVDWQSNVGQSVVGQLTPTFGASSAEAVPNGKSIGRTKKGP